MLVVAKDEMQMAKKCFRNIWHPYPSGKYKWKLFSDFTLINLHQTKSKKQMTATFDVDLGNGCT